VPPFRRPAVNNALTCFYHAKEEYKKMVRTTIEALSIFTVSILILSLASIIPQINTHKATGSWWFEAKGYVLILVGVLYIVAGFVLTRLRR
jgi:hypothetical protein